MRILLDTNVLISGLWIAGNPPARLLDAWRDFKITLVTSREQLEELADVLARPKIARRISPERAERLLGALREEAIWATEIPVLDLSPDPDDNRILATAIAGKAEMVVSGDRRDMLELGEVDGIPIVTAREAVQRLGLENED